MVKWWRNCTWSLPSRVLGMVTHLVGWTPLVVMAVIRWSSSSRFSFNFFTNDSMARLENASLSPPCREPYVKFQGHLVKS